LNKVSHLWLGEGGADWTTILLFTLHVLLGWQVHTTVPRLASNLHLPDLHLSSS
jgi:hypothetical protein